MKRAVSGFAVAALALSLFAGCSKNDTTSTGPAAQSNSNSSTTSSTAASNSKSGSGSDAGTKTGIPDLDKTMADANKCITMAASYASVFLPLVTSASDADKAKVKQQLEDMKKAVPDKISKDLDTIESGINNANSLSDLSKFLDSSEYKTANDEVTNYLDKECGKVGK